MEPHPIPSRRELREARSKLRIVEAKKKALIPYGEKMFELINEAYSDLYGFVTLTDEHIDVYIKQYFGFIHLLLALKFPKYIDFFLVAVRPYYQARRITAILMTEMTRNCLKNKICGCHYNIEAGSYLLHLQVFFYSNGTNCSRNRILASNMSCECI